MQKIIVVLTSDAFGKITGPAQSDEMRVHFGACELTQLADGRYLAAIQPTHYVSRFIVNSWDGVTVLPGVHDPAPLGDMATHLQHVKALPTETMRDVALRLHAAHGPAFHPDT